MSHKAEQKISLLNHSDTTSCIEGESGVGSSTRVEVSNYRSLSIKKVEFDDALTLVGGQNWYQIRAFLFFCAQWFFSAWVLQGSQFFMFPAQFDSKFCGNLSQDDCKVLACQQKDPKEHMINKDTSMVGTFDMVCDDSKQTLLDCLTQVGSLFGFFLFCWMADNQGRRVALGISWLIASLGVLLLALSWDYYSAVTGFFIGGFGAYPAITVQISLLSEHSIGNMREYTTIGLYVFYGIGQLVLVGIAYAIPDWRILTLYFLAIPMLVVNFGIYLVYESPKFVHERSTSQAFTILNNIAKVNNKEPLKMNTLLSVLNENQDVSYSYVHLFKYKSLRSKTILTCIIFFAINAIYYGVTYAMGKIGLNLYINVTIIASAESIAYGTTDHFIPKLRRKLTTLLGLAICGTLSISFQFLQEPDSSEINAQVIIQIIFAALIRFGICFVWTVAYVFMTELYPTVVRSLAIGLVSAIGTCGSIAAPYIGNLSSMINLNPMVSLGVLGFIGFASTFPLQETFNKPLEDQIEELKTKHEEIIIEQYE